jgi:peroxiredoxin Q/BCP
MIISFGRNSTQLGVNNKVSVFFGLDAKGSIWASDAITSHFLILYFYPAAMTDGCAKQACATV